MSWPALEAIVRDGQSALTMPGLAEKVRRVQQAATPEERAQALGAVADTIAATGEFTPWIVNLAAAPNPVARQLAMMLTGRSVSPLPAEALGAVQPLLRDRTIPEDDILAAALGMLRSTGLRGPGTREVLRSVIAGRGKARALSRLSLLEQRLGSFPVLKRLRSRVEKRVRLRCPRCRVKLRRPAMVQHLWEQHGLLFHEHRVREPWSLVDEWIGEHARDRAAGALNRATELARQLDPQNGLLRVQRLLLAHGVVDVDALRSLQAEARRQHGALCPRCYAVAVVPDERMPPRLNVSHGRLTAPGYWVEVSERGFVPRLEIETPRGMIYSGHEPGRQLTRTGATLVLAGPPVLAAMVLAVLLGLWDVPSFLPVVAALLAGLLAWLFVRSRWRPRVRPLDRAVSHAWNILAPRLHADGFFLEDSTFLGGLCLASIGRSRPLDRRNSLDRISQLTEKAVLARTAPAGHLAALWRLAAEDAAAAGRDPVAVTAEQIGRSLSGRLPVAFAEQLLKQWESPCWTPGNLARLRVILCDRAFEAGLEIADLLELGRMAPALGAALGTHDAEQLARLRLLWSLRPARPWDRCGPASTVFELASYPTLGGQNLAACPDLLFFQSIPKEDWESETLPPILVSGRGLVFEGKLFPEPPGAIEVRATRFPRGGYELIVGRQRFPFRRDPEPVLRRLENWFYYYFRDFLPQVAAVRGWRSPGTADKLRAREAVTCPECNQAFLPCMGEIGLKVEMAEERAS